MIKCLMLGAALLAVSGCYDLAFVASPGARVTTLAGRGGREFRVRTHYWFAALGGLPNTRLVEVDRLVSEKLGFPVRDISNLEIVAERSPDGLVPVIVTLGLLGAQTVVISGRIHSPIPKGYDRSKLLTCPVSLLVRAEQIKRKKAEKRKLGRRKSGRRKRGRRRSSRREPEQELFDDDAREYLDAYYEVKF